MSMEGLEEARPTGQHTLTCRSHQVRSEVITWVHLCDGFDEVGGVASHDSPAHWHQEILVRALHKSIHTPHRDGLRERGEGLG